ncbi:uncharacterized protein J4E92_008957 [Alternaria infectoria]|uniref:uncharacterized protein n=1 Tax=Alternaria infectoria TaxID=45303 RepID=UPI00221EE445|nr:uncharacterized protein J4E92_008957 [Alternaria infectoria]KAI4917563.1 hypothetical protein J4E92_008957 [Alternaria infectoria]
MPSLKDLNCVIELSGSQQALREFGTIYGDGFVETFVPVPNKPQSFSIHLTSNKFIAPGVAIFVYVDGVYQCNRNRQDLKLRKPSDSRSLVDFRVRQKEERQKDGSMIAREWAFDKLNIASADDAPNICSPNVLDNIGCIEVVVLRCAGTRNAKSASTMNFDGAGDFPDHRFGIDDSSSPSNERSMYDDRGPFFSNFGNSHGPPPPLPSYRSPYAETVRSPQGSTSRTHRTTYGAQELFPPAAIVNHSRPHSRYSEPISPGARRTNDLPPSGFQYGSGPIPRDGELYNTHPPHVGAVQPPSVDPMWLNNLLTTAVKQGVEESGRMDTQSEGQPKYKETNIDAKSATQPPGAWPESPFDAPTQPHQHIEQPAFSSREHKSEHGPNWAKPQPGWGERPPRSRAGTHVTWNAEPAFETDSSNFGGWNAREDTPSDTWDTGDTWPTNKAAEWDASSQQGKLWHPVAYAGPPAPVMATPEWDAAVHEAMRKPSNVPSNVFPAPYAPSMKEFVQSTAGDKLGGDRPSSLASWGNDKNDHTDKPSWGKATEKNLGWGKDTENGWQEKNTKENDKKGWYSTDDDQAGGWNEADGNKKIQAGSDWNRKDHGWDNPPSSPKQERVDKMNDWAGLKSALTSAFANPPTPAPEAPWPTQSWSFPADNAVKPTLQQPTPTPFASAPAPPAPASEKGRLPSQRMSNKTLSRYRPNHNFPSRIHPKPTPNFTAQPHWQFPPAPSTSTPKNVLHHSSPNDTYIAPAEPRLTISKSTSSKSGIEHAVRAGKATEYGHVVGRPEYLDRLEKPYAVFRFKYRSEGVLRGLGVLGEGDMKHYEHGKKEKQEVEKLKGIPQEELIAKMLALERKLKGKDDGEGTTVAGDGGKERKHSKTHADKEKQKQKQRRSSEKTDAHGDGRVKDFTEQWVERHSRDPSVKAKSAAVKEVGWEGDKERKEKEVMGTWGQDADEGWGGGGMKW